MKYLKFMPFNSIANASRNRREMSAAREYGYEVFCYSADRAGTVKDENLPCSLICDETAAPVLGPQVPHPIRVFRVFNHMLRHAKRLRGLGMDIISCHNIKALATAWLACIGLHGKRRPKLIYDSHEFELGREKRSKRKYRFLKMAEGFLIRKCAFTIVVNEGIGEELVKIHGLKQKPVALRSTPEYWTLEEAPSSAMREEYAEKLGVPEDSFIVSYTGIFMEYRGLEEIITALSLSQDVYAVWIGKPDSEAYQEKLDRLIDEAGIADRMLFYPMQPQKELWKYVSAASAAVVMNDGKNLNYKYALPNKFFEAIQSLTPIICSDTEEMARIVRQYDIGLLVPSGDGEALANAIQRMKDDKELYASFKNNLLRAKEDLCWEKEKNVLLKAFGDYLR